MYLTLSSPGRVSISYRRIGLAKVIIIKEYVHTSPLNNNSDVSVLVNKYNI